MSDTDTDAYSRMAIGPDSGWGQPAPTGIMTAEPDCDASSTCANYGRNDPTPGPPDLPDDFFPAMMDIGCFNCGVPG